MKLKQNNGITLISLIVTIIVLIILSGVSLNLVLGENGIITRAKYAKESYLNAQASEEESLGKLEEQLKGLPKNTKDTKAGTIVEPPSNWYTNTPNYAETENGEQVPVPLGFYYVGGTINSGVVISDNSKDQNKYAGEENVPAGVVYDTGTGIPKPEEQLTEAEKKTVILGNQFVWIPCKLADYKKVDWNTVSGKDYDNATWETQTHSSELPQIKKYEGFYVGRYEAGSSNITLSSGVKFEDRNIATNGLNDQFSIRDKKIAVSGKVTSKAGEIPYYHADYYTALELSNNMYNSNYVQSGLVTGTMWDVIMNFIAEGNNDIVTTASNWGNQYNNNGITYKAEQGRYATFSSNNDPSSAFIVSDAKYHYGIRTTASTEDVKKKNLYDIAGNLFEWTQEVAAAYPNNTLLESYELRSGSLGDTYEINPACFRNGQAATLTNTRYGFRVALFIM